MTPNQFKTQLRSDINKAIQSKGGAKALALHLGKSPSYVSKVLERNSFSGLHKLSELIEEILPMSITRQELPNGPK